MAETGASVPDQQKQANAAPDATLTCLACFEGISLVLMEQEKRMEAVQVTGLTEVHLFILGLLGPSYTKYYELSKETC